MTERVTHHHHRGRRLAQWLNLLVFLAAVLVTCAAGVFIAHLDRYGWRIDATKTRAYSLSPQTVALLDQIEGEWTISIVLVESNVDRAVLRQIEEVLDRYRESNAQITVERIDPTGSASLAHYEALIQRLRDLYSPQIEDFESRLADAREALQGVIPYAANEVDLLGPVIAQVGGEGALGSELASVRNGFSLIAQNGPQILDAAATNLVTDESRPLPDYEAARDTLYGGATQAAEYLADIASRFNQYAAVPGLPEAARQHFVTRARTHQSLAAALMLASDPLLHLRPLELTSIAHELARGEAAVITSADRAAVVPAWQLFPRLQRADREGTVTFDERFRGEQILSSTIRSLVVDHMPMVVFLHAGSESILRQSTDRKDVFGSASILQSSRYDVMEWRAEQVERPRPAPGQQVVWIVVPPAPGENGGNPAVKSKEELLLLERARLLVDGGEAVLLSFYPSVLHKLRQPDPWQDLARSFNIDVQNDSVVFEAATASDGRRIVSQHIELLDLPSDHTIARAVHGQRLGFVLPVPVKDGGGEVGSRWSIAEVTPASNRWLDEEWVTALAGGTAEANPDAEQVFAEPISIVAAVERPHPLQERGSQRIVAVGSGSWMLTGVADYWHELGGERIALQFPGNYELLQASVAWLAGMDELIAQSPTSQQVQRLEGLTDRNRMVWWWMVMAGLPGAALVMGMVVWMARRR